LEEVFEMFFDATFESWRKSVPEVLDGAGFSDALDSSGKETVLLKPNIVSDQPPRVTTHVGIVAAAVDHIRCVSPSIRIVVGEGVGMKEYDTSQAFRALGFAEMAKEKNVELLDLNKVSALVHLTAPERRRWPEMWLPEIVMESFLLSIPVLKAHSMADVTLTMKNMMGTAPPKHFDAGTWRKSAFHSRIHEAIFELNLYRTPDFTLLDAVEGMAEAHLWGAECDPPPNKIAASADPVAIDAWGCARLGIEWSSVPHIQMADGILGEAAFHNRR
jgi:uncharacterized protein (DUF362 family)